MEDRAAYHAPAAPKGLRDLSDSVATWLRAKGFTVEVTTLDDPAQTFVRGHWAAPCGNCFSLEYTYGEYVPAYASCSMWVRNAFGTTMLFSPQRVGKRKHIERLLWGSVCFSEAWRDAHPLPELPATS